MTSHSLSTTTTPRTNWNSLPLEIKTIIVNSCARSSNLIREPDEWEIDDLHLLLTLRLVNNELLALADDIFFEYIPFSKLAAGEVDSFVEIFPSKYLLRLQLLNFFVATSLFVGVRDHEKPLFPLELPKQSTSGPLRLRGGAPSASDIFLEEKRGHQLITLLTLLPNLTSINIDLVKSKQRSFYPYQYTQYKIVNLLSNFIQVENLCLTSPEPHLLSTSFLAGLLLNFQELVTLELRRVGDNSEDIREGINLGTSVSKLSKLKHLGIHDSRCLDKYFFDQKWTQQLASFYTNSPMPSYILFPFLNQIGTDLTLLTITLSETHNTLVQLNLPSLATLRYEGPAALITHFSCSTLLNRGQILLTTQLKDSRILINFLSLLPLRSFSILCKKESMSDLVTKQVEAYISKVNMPKEGGEGTKPNRILSLGFVRSTRQEEVFDESELETETETDDSEGPEAFGALFSPGRGLFGYQAESDDPEEDSDDDSQS